MDNHHTAVQHYTHLYVMEYMKKIFFFCLKKTNNPQEAEDLTSDISLCILTELKRGVIPEHFSAWIWQIARNRYSRWAKQKRKRNESVFPHDICNFEIADNNTAETAYLKHEELTLLRRELALISSDYRRILIAYYMEECPIRDIASMLHLTEGAVKMRLFRARNLLKEGMNMAREFGTKSYNPEEVRFAATGNQPGGLPWSAVNRKLPKNILLQASNNPSTIEELSLELGIAAPYMEEECELLCKADLLQKTGSHYVTNFFIMNRECQTKLYYALREHSQERSLLIDRIADDLMPVLNNPQIVRNGMNSDELKWWLTIYIVDYCITQLKGYTIDWPQKRKHGGTWGFIGYETVKLPETTFLGHNGCGKAEDTMFWAYKIPEYHLWERAGELSYEQTILLGDLIRNRRTIASLTGSEQGIWENIKGRFAYADEHGRIIPAIPVFENERLQQFQKSILEHPLSVELLQMLQEEFDRSIQILKDYNIEILHKTLPFCATMNILNNRMMMIHDEIKNGRLIVPEAPSHSTIAMHLEVSNCPA